VVFKVVRTDKKGDKEGNTDSTKKKKRRANGPTILVINSTCWMSDGFVLFQRPPHNDHVVLMFLHVLAASANLNPWPAARPACTKKMAEKIPADGEEDPLGLHEIKSRIGAFEVELVRLAAREEDTELIDGAIRD